ncbi:hypothetical protein A2U01_0059228, partial [Trifolium medium]|nr:hypothetical protein [Trifolium medium]
TCNAADEARGNDDRFEHTCNCSGLASCITCSN